MRPTPYRLEQYRNEATSGKWTHPLTWRDTKRHHPSAWGAPSPNNVRGPEGQIYSDSLGQYGDDLGPVDRLFPRMLECSGWYADNYQEELIIGHVIRMRCPRGTLYIPATVRTDSDGTVHYLADADMVPKGASEYAHEAAQREAARSANYYAEKEAEESREYYAKDQAEQDIIQARAEIHEINKKALALFAELRPARTFVAFAPNTCMALQARICEFLRDRAEQFKIINAREENYWSACPGY